MSNQLKSVIGSVTGLVYRAAYTTTAACEQTHRRWVAAGGPLAVAVAVASMAAAGRAVLNTVIPGTKPPTGVQ